MTAFLHPWVIWVGVAAATLPVAVHWLTRARPKRIALSTIKFLHEAVRDRRARNRLRDFLVLSCRTLAVLFFAIAIARPLFDRSSVVSPDPEGAVARVVILDVSQSMGAESHGVQSLERGRSVAQMYLQDRPDIRAGLVLAGSGAESVFDRLSVNAAALRAEVGQVSVRPERLNVSSAITRAAELLAMSSDGVKRELVIVSDFQRTNWAEVDFAPLPADTAIQLESVAPVEPPANLAVLRVNTPPRIEQGRDARIEIEVGNFSANSRSVTLEVTLGDAVSRIEGMCAAWGKTTLTIEIPSRTTGWQIGSARLVNANDAIPADDIRPFVLDVRPPPSFVLLTRQPAGLVPSSSYYLSRALVPITLPVGRAASRVARVDSSQAEADALAAADAIVLDHPGKLSSEIIRQLATLLKRGTGVLYVAAEPQDATNLKLLGDAAGGDLKPPVEFAPAARGARRANLFLAEVKKDQSPFAVFGDGLANAIEGLRFGGGLSSRPRDDGLADEILATLSDRTAAIVAMSCGDGTLVVLNADLDASNLPSSPAFVPIIGELVERLTSRKRTADAVPCGEPVALNLARTAGPASGLELHGPNRDTGKLKEDASGVTWSHPGPRAAGVYSVTRQGNTVFAVAAAVPPEESDLRPLVASVISQKAGAGRAIGYRSAAGSEQDRDSRWAHFAIACVLCMLGELAALKWFKT
jgi:Aerotolerance regulator N-terminal/von Willebrand factor type A domain